MKNLSRLLLIMLFLIGNNTIQAQDEKSPWQITIGMNAINEYPNSEGGVFSDVFLEEYLNVSDHWNILPSISMIGVSRYIGKGFSAGITGTLNQIKNRGYNIDGEPNVLVNELTYYSFDASLKYNLLNPGKTLDPFVVVGGGYSHLEEVEGTDLPGDGITANGFLGLNIWVNQTFGFTMQTGYKHAFGDTTTENDLNSLFQHSIGLTIKFAGLDTDNDGIIDSRDLCPEEPGVKAFGGCPDTDGDGIQDSEDNCPDEPGPIEYKGCPDTDGDGIIDSEDNCPEVAGLEELAGCPDTDGDGVTDEEDECADVAGPSENKGCPWPDTDGDTVLDKDDKCPEVKGTVEDEGCPHLTVEVQKTLNEYAKIILFDSSNSKIKEESEQLMADIISILEEYKSAKFTIEGHTDSTGSKASNQILSETRANTVKDYLIEHGIEESRLTSKGFGESKPVDTNDTSAGRKNNRRVEINLVK